MPWPSSWSCASRRVTRRLAHDHDAGYDCPVCASCILTIYCDCSLTVHRTVQTTYLNRR